MKLLIEYYKSLNTQRNEEYIFTLKKNIENVYITDIYVFIDDISLTLDLKHDKLHIIYIDNRYTFYDFFIFSKENFLSEKVILANSDIFFDDTLEYIENFDLSGKIVTLTRYEYNTTTAESVYSDSDCSQDVWGFCGGMVIEDSNFLLGTLGCDNRIAYLANEQEILIRNPSLTIKSYHVHESNYRTYTEQDRVKASYLFMLPNNDINKNVILSIYRLKD